MNRINGKLPAAPISEEETDRVFEGVEIYTGLTKREAFAMHAMQGLLSDKRNSDRLCNETTSRYKGVSRAAVDYADALLEALEQSKNYRVKPEKQEAWVNIYGPMTYGGIFGSKKEAISGADTGLIACIRIEYTEGQGL